MFVYEKPYIIKRKLRPLRFSNQYEIIERETQSSIGVATEDISIFTGLGRILTSKANLTNCLVITDKEINAVEIIIRKPSSFVSANIQVFNNDNSFLGRFTTKFISGNTGVVVTDSSGNEIATITADWKGWNYQIKSPNGVLLGTVKKIWSGILNEFILNRDTCSIELSNIDSLDSGIKKLLFAASLSIFTLYRFKG